MNRPNSFRFSIAWAALGLCGFLSAAALTPAVAQAPTITFSVNVGSPVTAYPGYSYTGFFDFYSTRGGVKVTCSDASAQLRYTTDGTAPGLASAALANNGVIPLDRLFTLTVSAFSGGVPVVSRAQTFHSAGMITAGADHALALPFAGDTVWAWGLNSSKQLGWNYPTLSTTAQGTKVGVISSTGALLTGVKAVAAGSVHSLAVLNDGTMRTWGLGTNGQLGNNGTTSTAENYIATVRDGTGVAGTQLANVIAVAAGALHNLAVVTDASATGKVWAWGNNAGYQIGDNAASTTDKKFPVPVLAAVTLSPLALAPLTGVEDVAAGLSHSVARTSSGAVYSWGTNSYGQVLGTAAVTALIKYATPVTSFGNAQDPALASAIACGDNFTLVVRVSDGSVWGWGYNVHGELGNDPASTAEVHVPVYVVDFAGNPLRDIVQVVAGQYHAIALDSDGHVFTWGYNGNGRLGDGSATAVTASRKYAKLVTVPGWDANGKLSGKVVAIAAGSDFSMALTETGALFTWGNQANGRLGNGSTASGNVLSPTGSTLLPDISNQPPSAGTLTSYGIDPPALVQPARVSVYASPTDPDNNLARVDFTVDGVPHVTAGPWLTIVEGLTAGSHIVTATAVDLYGLSSPVSSTTVTIALPTIAADPAVSCAEGGIGSFPIRLNKAQTNDLNVDYSFGGTATPSVDYTAPAGPVLIPAGQTLANVPVTALLDHPADPETVILTLAPSALYAVSPASATLTIADVLPVATPSFRPPRSAYARVETAQIQTTAGATLRYTIDGSAPGPTSPTHPPGGLLRVPMPVTIQAQATKSGLMTSLVGKADLTGRARVAEGAAHTVLLNALGNVLTWGSNDQGQLGRNGSTDSNTPGMIAGVAGATSIAGGDKHTVVSMGDGTVWTVGLNGNGQLGDGTMISRGTVGMVAGLMNAAAVSAGAAHTVVLKTDQTVESFGSNSDGQLGNGTIGPSTTPVAVSISGAAAVASGSYHVLALKSDGTVWAWGRGLEGQIGDGSVNSRSTPVQVSTLGGVVAISAGAYHSLALKSDGTVWTWGANADYQVRGTSGASVLTPMQVATLTEVVAIAAGGNLSMAVEADGTMICWGRNANGESAGPVGTIRVGLTSTPRMNAVRAIAAGRHALALTDEGALWGWGDNSSGQLGAAISASNDPRIIWSSPQDTDHDGLPDEVELALGSNPNQWDTNGDGLSDGAAYAAGLSVTGNDTDGDGLTNQQEIALGTNLFAADSDGDGVDDGLDPLPLDPNPPSGPGISGPPVITLLSPPGAQVVP